MSVSLPVTSTVNGHSNVTQCSRISRAARSAGERQESAAIDSELEKSSISQEETATYSGGPIIALNWMRSKIGCAYYDDEFKQLYVMDDSSESRPFNIAVSLLEQIRPDIIVLPSDIDDLRCEIDNFYKDVHLGPVQIETMSGKAFAYEAGKAALVNWHIQRRNTSASCSKDFATSSIDIDSEDKKSHYLPARLYCEDPLDGRRRQAYLELSSTVSFDSKIAIGCIGALLSFLDEMKMTCETYQCDQYDLFPLHLRKLVCDQYMQVFPDTQRALQIFEKDFHPNVHSKRSKESLSLFGVLDHTVTPLGRHLLNLWLQHPSLNMDVLNGRHQAVELFTKSEISSTIKDIKSSLSHIKNIARVLNRVRGNQANPNEWQQLLQFACYCLRIRTAVFQQLSQQDVTAVPILQMVLERFDTDCLKTVVSYIDNMIDFGKSSTENRLIVKSNVDEELDNMKKIYEDLDSLLLQVAEEICVDLPPQMAALCNVVYFPQLGYLVTVPCLTQYANIIARLPGFDLQFRTAENLYYKNNRTKELDESLGDIHELIIDREIELIQELSDQLLQYSTRLLAMADICAELDCLISLSTAAKSYNYVRPRMTTENKIIIDHGRHPLQELNVDVFIANDTRLYGGHGLFTETNDTTTMRSMELGSSVDIVAAETSRDTQSSRCSNESSSVAPKEYSVWLLSGANFSGKSVYIRQVAMITYMAHVGSFVPAEEAVIGLTDKMFACIQTVESISKLQSAFALELQQLSQALRYATSRSLIIIDEFGKGTSTNDGAALLCASLDYLLLKGVNCPKVLAVTHFHDLISRGIILPDKHKIGLLTMEIIHHSKTISLDDQSITVSMSTNTARMGEEVVFLYKVLPCNRPTSSFGAWCASIAGLPSDIVQRAMDLSSIIDNGGSISPVTADEAEYRKLGRLYEEFMNFRIDTESPESLSSCKDIINAVRSIF